MRLRREVVRLKRELGTTSAQDQFAKWAKLQRQYDKTLAEHEKKCTPLPYGLSAGVAWLRECLID